MSKTDGMERVIAKEVDVKRGGGEPKKSVQEELYERREAVEKDREEREKPRKDFLAGKGGKASDHFDSETFHPDDDQSGHPKEIEDLSESERERWLRTGELFPAKPKEKTAAKKEEPQGTKPPEKPKTADFVKDGQMDHEGFERALDDYEVKKAAFDKSEIEQKNAEPSPEQKAEFDKNLDKELFEEIGKKRDWWNEEGHAEAHKTLPERTVAGIQALPEQEKAVIANSPVRTMQLDPEFDGFLGHAMARVKNLGRIHLELAKDPALVKRMNDDFVKSKSDSKFRWVTEKTIRYMLQLWDKKAGSAGNGERGAARKTDNLTRAGRPMLESSGSSSSPSDDGSSDAAWRRKDLSVAERGELYRERKNAEEVEATRKKYARPRRR